MKMRKGILSFLLLLLFVVIVAACGKDPRKDFTSALYSTNDESFNAAKFDMSIKEFDMKTNDTTGSAYINMFANQLKNMTIDGSYAINEKDESYEMEMNLNLLGQKIPIQLVGEKEKAYLSTNLVSSFIDIANSFGVPLDIASNDLKTLEGKYIDIEQTGDTLASDATDDSSNLFKNLNPTKASDSKLTTELKKSVESFDKESFKTDGDKITHTFTKDELLKLLEVSKTVAKEEKDTDTVKELEESIDSIKNTMKKLDVKTTINKKTNKLDLEISVDSVSEDSEDEQLSLTMTFSVQPQKNEQKIILPDSKNILTQEQLETILGNLSASTSTQTETDTDSVSDAEIEQELNELITQIEASPESVTEDVASSLRTSGALYLNEEQMTRLNAALDAALAK